MVEVAGTLYVVGGITRGARATELWAYDIAAGTWRTDLADLPTEREHLSVVAVDGKVYAVGGRKVSNKGAVEVYDPATNAWTSLPDMPTPRGGMAIGVLGSTIHTAGGENLNAMSTYPQHEVLDLATGTWSRGPDLPTKRHGLAAAVVGDRWYVIGGGRAATLSVSDVVEIFTP
jgi:non-specific serine/threonine protein kinase